VAGVASATPCATSSYKQTNEDGLTRKDTPSTITELDTGAQLGGAMQCSARPDEANQ